MVAFLKEASPTNRYLHVSQWSIELTTFALELEYTNANHDWQKIVKMAKNISFFQYHPLRMVSLYISH